MNPSSLESIRTIMSLFMSAFSDAKSFISISSSTNKEAFALSSSSSFFSSSLIYVWYIYSSSSDKSFEFKSSSESYDPSELELFSLRSSILSSRGEPCFLTIRAFLPWSLRTFYESTPTELPLDISEISLYGMNWDFLVCFLLNSMICSC